MRIESAFNSGLQGFQRAEQVADRASGQLARLNTPSGDQVQVPDELINLKSAE
ncbi:MAG: flagellar biosynthesis protein FlgE, partial [Aeromonas jandaei]